MSTDIALRLTQFKYSDDKMLAITFSEVLREGAEEINRLHARVKELEDDRAQLKDEKDALIEKLRARIRNPRPSRRVKRLTARFAKALRLIADMPCEYQCTDGMRCKQAKREDWCASCIAERALLPVHEREDTTMLMMDGDV